MNFRRKLGSTRYYLFLGTCLIFVGYTIFSQQKTGRVKKDVTPTLVQSSPSTYSKVTRVIDGDTIVIDTGQHIRYIGMNTPEVESDECFASEATEINKSLVLGKVVRLEKDLSEMDKYGRLLRFVYIGDTFVDDYLVKNGYAKVMPVPPDVKYKDRFEQSEEYARQNGLGLWSECL
jgi:micrococcal nuclease